MPGVAGKCVAKAQVSMGLTRVGRGKRGESRIVAETEEHQTGGGARRGVLFAPSHSSVLE